MVAVGAGLLLLGVLRLGQAGSLSAQLMRYAPSHSGVPLLDGEDPFDERIRRLELQLGLSSSLSSTPHATFSAEGQSPDRGVVSPPPPAPLSQVVASSADSSSERAAPARGEVWDNSRILSSADVLRRVPRGRLAFVALANSAYADLAVNWALALLPVLESLGESHHAVLAALDDASGARFVQLRLPTLRVGMGGINNTNGDVVDFRWAMSAFRAYGVTKAEVRPTPISLSVRKAQAQC
jgi:hypothetical protein